MDDEERQRTMDFILRQQAQFTVGMQKLEEQQAQFAAGMQKIEEQQGRFAAGMQRLEEADARASERLGRLERVVVLMARQFRRERGDLRERTAALVDAQIRTEEVTRQNGEAIRALTKAVDDINQRGSGNGNNS